MTQSLDVALRLALYRTEGIGPAAWARLTAHLGPPENWAAADTAVLRSLLTDLQWRALDRTLSGNPLSVAGVGSDMAWLATPGHHVLWVDRPGYPERLAAIHQPAPLLFVRGDPALLALPQLAVVGTRYPTRHALLDCRDFCLELARRGVVITSGLALGIDAAAHLAALDAGGRTVAVLAHGLDSVYPPRHKPLAGRILSQGALVSEFPVGVQPRPDAFPRRNRLISGLSLGVWVVEGALQSGSMITAREAVEQGREVFALPGSIRNPLTRGCHRLIRQGALLVESPDDIYAELMLLNPPGFAPSVGRAAFGDRLPSAKPGVLAGQAGVTTEDGMAALLATLSTEYRSANEIADALHLPVGEVLGRLSLLVLEGRVHTESGRYVRV
jgi:DNA processing protein